MLNVLVRCKRGELKIQKNSGEIQEQGGCCDVNSLENIQIQSQVNWKFTLV